MNKEKLGKKFDTEEEATDHLIGRIAGINDIRISVMGIGYDNDKTALMIRKKCTDKIYELKEILEIKVIGDLWFDDARTILDKLKCNGEENE